MHLLEISFTNIKAVRKFSHNFELGTTLITGENDRGKTTIFVAVRAAITGELKKHLVNNQASSGKIFLKWEYMGDIYAVEKEFFTQANKSATAKLWINDMKKPQSTSCKYVKDTLRKQFYFFHSLGFLWAAKIGRILMEHNIKKDAFIVDFFELQPIYDYIKSMNKHINNTKKSIPDWVYDFNAVEAKQHYTHYKAKAQTMTEEITEWRTKLKKLQKKLGQSILLEGRTIATEEEHQAKQSEIAKFRNAHTKGTTMRDMKQNVLRIVSGSELGGACPICYSEITDSAQLRDKIAAEIDTLDAKCSKRLRKLRELQEASKKLIVINETVQTDPEEIEKLRVKEQKIEDKVEKLDEKRGKYAVRVEQLGDNLREYRRYEEKLKTADIDNIAAIAARLTGMMDNLARKLKTELVDRMNEFMYVVYDGERTIQIEDGVIYLIDPHGEKILLDELSSSGSGLEIVTFIFTLSLSILCGNKVILLDEIFNTVGVNLFPKVNKLLAYATEHYLTQVLIISHKTDFISTHSVQLQ